MKKICLFLACLVLLFPCKTFAKNLPQSITLNTVGNPPLNTPEKSGFMDLVVSSALSKIGLKLNTVHLPAERGLKNANLGVEDGEMSRIAGLEKLYPNLIRVPEKLMDWEFVAFSAENIDLNNGWQSLSGYTVAYINGWKIFENNTRSLYVTKVKNVNFLFKLLQKKRADIILYEKWGGLLMRNKLNASTITLDQPPLAKKPMYIYLHKKHKDLVAPLAKALREMKQDGSYKKIETEILIPLLGSFK